MKDLVSVIVPVYNVENYLDKCVRSIVNQTYSNMEIILVNDGSTDASSELCRTWAAGDRRITVLNQENAGLAGARNAGVRYSHGEYFVFVDSDDWIAPEYVESLLNAAVNTKADMAVCDYWVCHGTQRKMSRRQSVEYGLLQTMEEKGRYLISGHISMCCKIYRRDFYINTLGDIPRIKYEDFAVFPQLTLAASKIMCIKESLYYYRTDRGESIMNSSDSIAQFHKALEYCIAGVSKYKSGEVQKSILLCIVRAARNAFGHTREGQDTGNAVTRTQKALDMNFPWWRRCFAHTPLVVGSFNLRWIVQRLMPFMKDIQNYYGFTGLIGQYMGTKLDMDINGSNPFRERQLKQDFMQMLCEEIASGDADYVFVDLMNEVENGIIITENNQFLTESEAYRELCRLQVRTVCRLKYSDEEYRKYWHEACDRFAEDLHKAGLDGRVVLVRSRFAREYTAGNERRKFDDAEEAERKNAALEKMEQYFLWKLPGAEIIDIPQEMLFNDEERYERSSLYLNYRAYDYAAVKWFTGERRNPLPKTTVIIPVYNVEAYIEECLLSVLGQTQKEIQVIVVDDGSTDGSMEIVKRLSVLFDDIRIIRQANQGLSAARNRGLKEAKGEYIYFLDSDDYISEDTLQLCYEQAQQTDAEVVMFDAVSFGSAAGRGNYDRSSFLAAGEVNTGIQFLSKYMDKEPHVVSSCLLYQKREFLLQNGLTFMEGIYHEDEEYYFRLMRAAKRICYLPRQFYHRRWREGSIMTMNAEDRRLEGYIRGLFSMLSAADGGNATEMRYIARKIWPAFERYGKIAGGDDGLLSIKTKCSELIRGYMEVFGGQIAEEDKCFYEYQICLLEDGNMINAAEITAKRDRLAGNVLRKLPLRTLPLGKIAAIYGIGGHTDKLLSEYERLVGTVKAKLLFIDSSRASKSVQYRGYDVYNIADIGEFDIELIVISSFLYEGVMKDKIKRFYGDKYKVLRFYDTLPFTFLPLTDGRR